MLKGYFAKISRNIINTPYYNNATLLRAWMGLILSVRFTPTVVDGIDVGINEVLVTKDGIAELFGVPKSRAYYVLKKMENDGLVTWLNIRNKYTLITIREENFASLTERRIRRPDGPKNSISIEEANNMSMDEELLPGEWDNASDSEYGCGTDDYYEAYDNENENESPRKAAAHDTAFENPHELSDEGFKTKSGCATDTAEEKKDPQEELQEMYEKFCQEYDEYDDDDDDDDDGYSGYYPKKKNYGYYKKNYKSSGYKKSTRKASAYKPFKVNPDFQRRDYSNDGDYYSAVSPYSFKNTAMESRNYEQNSMQGAKALTQVESRGTKSGSYTVNSPEPAPAKKSPEDNKMKFGEYSNVLLTRDEYNDLNMRLIKARAYIDDLSSEIAKSHKKYDSHYQELLSRYKDELLTV